TFRYKKKDLLGTTQSRNILIEFSNKKLVESARTNYYLRGFHRALFYRSNCYNCKYAIPQRVSDITLGDYWSIQEIEPKMTDTSGVSCVLVNSKNGGKVFQNLISENDNLLEVKETPADFLYKHNGQLSSPSVRHKQRDRFMELLQTTDFCEAIDLTLGKRNKIKTTILDLMPYKVFYGLRRIFKR
ncbi:MAG: Coenzyme F420 hydrogenase/dehydrogenase, beta subunit C-terminal domain, partial [Bacteroides thetaiotaomicron]|nr:Coenzyme F420 hydrogenase/dehydrogenase, beta subunit C-terminal domain [Bacteroides thetaiotaomicron]